MEKLLDYDGAAERLGTTKRHLYELVMKREIPFVKVGRYTRFKVRDLEEWIAEQTTEAS